MLPLAFVTLLGLTRNLLGKEIYDYYNKDTISYKNLRELKISCYPSDSCMEERSNDSPGIAFGYSCSCDIKCSQLGTCCVDSPYRDNSPPTQKCRPVEVPINGTGYYMVHKCPNNIDRNSLWKQLCDEEREDEDDLVKLAPVTSLKTSTTYKNYYCFRCHETTDKFLYWKLTLRGHAKDFETGPESDYSSVTYNRPHKTWVAMGKYLPTPVKLLFKSPEGLQHLQIPCDLDVISDCPDTWRDKSTREKCNAYAAIVYARHGKLLKYKNAHCAQCNSKSMNAIFCKRHEVTGSGGDFSSRLMNVNPSDGNKYGQSECPSDSTWDPFKNECKKIRCVVESYVIKDGKCVPP